MKIKYLEDCLLLEIENKEILVVGDIHIGEEEYGIQIKSILDKFERVFDVIGSGGIEIDEIVLLGDIKHDFSGVSYSEKRDIYRLIDYLEKKVRKIVIIKGNHDNYLISVLRGRGIGLLDCYSVGNVVFLHGDRGVEECLNRCLNSVSTRVKSSTDISTNGQTDNSTGLIVMGHLHPAISLKDEYKKEKYKCFLRGQWKKCKVIVVPSFSEYGIGFDLRLLKNDDSRSFISGKDLKNFEIVVYDSLEGKEYEFGKLSDLV